LRRHPVTLAPGVGFCKGKMRPILDGVIAGFCGWVLFRLVCLPGGFYLAGSVGVDVPLSGSLSPVLVCCGAVWAGCVGFCVCVASLVTVGVWLGCVCLCVWVLFCWRGDARRWVCGNVGNSRLVLGPGPGASREFSKDRWNRWKSSWLLGDAALAANHAGAVSTFAEAGGQAGRGAPQGGRGLVLDRGRPPCGVARRACPEAGACVGPAWFAARAASPSKNFSTDSTGPAFPQTWGTVSSGVRMDAQRLPE
jgi:hypothetical protein